MGWFSSSSDAKPDSMAAAAMEQQIEMMEVVFTKAVDLCGKSCIPPSYKEGELNKGEAVCVKRCVEKFFASLEIVGKELADIGAASNPQR